MHDIEALKTKEKILRLLPPRWRNITIANAVKLMTGIFSTIATTRQMNVTALRKLAKTGSCTDSVIRGRILVGIIDNFTRKKFLQTTDLTSMYTYMQILGVFSKTV